MRFCASQQCAIASGRFSTHAPRSSILRHASVRRPKRAFMPSSCRPYRSAWPRSRNRAAQPVRRTARSPRPGPRRDQSQSAPHQGPVVGGIADESWSATGRFDRAGGAYSGVDGYIGEHQPINPIGKLSNFERQILQLVAECKSTADIASTLFLSPKTVDTYRSRLMQKLDLDSFAALVKFAIACGLTPP